MEGVQKDSERPQENDRTTIRLGIGLGDLQFGANREEVRKYLGRPEEVVESNYAGDENDTTEAWYYWKNQISAHFDSEDEFRLGNLITHDRDSLLNGEKLIGLPKKQVLDKLHQLGFGEPDLEDMSSEEKPEYELASYDSRSLNLWFDHGRLDSIQWGYLFKDDRETQIWPQ